ncbi:Helix-turn-helix domain-containing protein [Pseudomonas helmanticensis]|uniref:Helix-turn-helix domain-containing protein n=1 Tax=Pseudomonas helmanticensis TaxID=1471381 RepID=A0ACD2UDP3_9PSED|nr:helix-turn-helix transcriptional regulator [Pseudomonas helmanticensis]SMQ30289.1 Helix-turn-helix domain-containing protein [Pseudomonas helmanticensis]
MTSSTLSIRLKQARLRAKLSQEELGIRIGLEPASASARMNRYELGKRTPDPELIQRVATELRLPAAYFYACQDDEAELLERYHALSAEAKAELMGLLQGLE